MDFDLTTLGKQYSKEYGACFRAVLDFYRANDIFSVLEGKSVSDWQSVAKSGFFGYTPKEQEQPMDLVVFQDRKGEYHLAIYVEHGKFYHLRKGKTTINRIPQQSWQKIGVFACLR